MFAGSLQTSRVSRVALQADKGKGMLKGIEDATGRLGSEIACINDDK